MEKKEFFENIRKEANMAFSSIIDKVEEVTKTSRLKLKISSLKSQIKDSKYEIGDIVYNNRDKIKDMPEIQLFIDKIKNLEEEIKLKTEHIKEMHEQEKHKTNEENKDSDKS